MTTTTDTTTRTRWTLQLPHSKPPLSMNDRGDHRTRGRKIAKVRAEAKWLATNAGLPTLQRARLALHYVPRDNRRRDAVNLCATLKACVDGLVDAGVLADDDDTRAVTPMPRIHHARPGKPGQLVLVVEALPPALVHLLPADGERTACCGRDAWEIPRWDTIAPQPVLDAPTCGAA